jgi:hypothetical protein
MALNAGAVNYDERRATSKNHDSFTALLTGARPAVQGAVWSLPGLSAQVAQDFCD